jgi:hypothetical protein
MMFFDRGFRFAERPKEQRRRGMNNEFSRIGRSAVFFLMIGVLGMLSGCCGIHKPFELIDDKTIIKTGTVAVISADSSEPTVRLADYLTRELKERSTFKVLSQEEVARRLGRYPVKVKQGTPDNPDKPIWFAKGEKAKVDAMQAQLNTDYVFLVWTDNLRKITRTGQGGSSVTYSVDVYGNLVEYPKSRAIGYTSFARNQSQSCCLFGKSEGDDIHEMVKGAAGSMADDLISAAKAEKPGK